MKKPAENLVGFFCCGLQVTGCGLRVAGCGLRVAGYEKKGKQFNCFSSTDLTSYPIN